MKNLKILIVEDAAMIMQVNKIIMRSVGYRADYVNSAEEALKLYFDNLYDLIITDIVLPNMNGFEMSLKIRQFEEKYCLDRSTIIAITSQNISEIKENLLQSGVDRAYSKPMNKNLMLNIIQSCEKSLEIV